MILKCLIVDDEPLAHQLLENYIGKLSFLEKIGNAYNAVEALSIIRSQNPDLVFLDINMPDVDGWAFLEKFKKINELIKFEVKIFILSSSINPEDVEKAKNNNFVTNYFAKPLMMDGIIAIKEMYS